MVRAFARLFAVAAVVVVLGSSQSALAGYVYSATVAGASSVDVTSGVDTTFDVTIKLTRTADTDTRLISGINFGFFLPNGVAGNEGTVAGLAAGLFTGTQAQSSTNSALLSSSGGPFASVSAGLFNMFNYRASAGYSGAVGGFTLANGASIVLATLKVTVLGTTPVGDYAAKFRFANSAPFTNIVFTNFTSARPTDTNSLLTLNGLNINVVRPAVVIPEPATVASAAVAILGSLVVARRRRAQV